MKLGAPLTLIAMSLVFFLITATTFSSLGVVLPAMIEELHWSWSGAGSGFSLLGVAAGITATIPAILIRKLGARVTLGIGSLVMAAAFGFLAIAHGLVPYFAGCFLMGLGFTLLATVPGTYLLARLFARPSFAFGVYFTLGGLGGVAGPILYLWTISFTHDWRAYWWAALVAVTAVGLLSAVLVDVETDVRSEGQSDPEITESDWPAKQAMKTPQFVVLAAAYSIFPFVGITVNAVAVAHLMGHGVAITAAGAMMSVEALFNAGARFLGGVMVRWIHAKALLLIALALMMAGLMALTYARGTPLMLIYAIGVGMGYGLTFFASTILLLDYFGRSPNLELFAMVNLISTVGAAGPAFAGLVADRAGSFVPAFVILAGLVLLVLFAVAPMRPPTRGPA